MTTIDPELMPVEPAPTEGVKVVDDPLAWVRRNLFRTPLDALLTVVAGLVVAYVMFRLGKFVFVSGRWTIVRVNLRLFMIGRYPAADLWRVVACGLGLSFFFGIAVGSAVQVQRLEFGPPEPVSPVRRVLDVLRRLWPLLIGIVLLLAMTTTVWPTIFVAALAVAFIAGRVLADRVPDRYIVWFVIAAVVSVGVLVWFPNGPLKIVLVAALAAGAAAGALLRPLPPAPVVLAIVGAAVIRIVVGGRELFGTPLMVVLVAAVAVATVLGVVRIKELPHSVAFWLAVAAIPLSVSAIRLLTRPNGWDDWGGMMMNLFLAVAGISLCFPLGILLALGRRAGRPEGSVVGGVIAAIILGGPVLVMAVLRGIDFGDTTTKVLLAVALLLGVVGFVGGTRSSLPVLRVLSVLYIELIRGAPLFVLLLVSGYSLAFFLPRDFDAPGFVVRAIVVFTLFTAAYIAEIIRGGLQSLPRGQTEAAQALGLSPAKTTGLVVMPQALRNVIPAIVGQFISLFKDTTLAGAALGLLDLLQVSDAAVNQPRFDGQALTPETVTFVMFVFWVGCITMSRESQRLERKLGVGTR